MKREIEFRGRTAKCEWVYGDLLNLHNGDKYIVNNKFGACIDDKGNFINTESPFVCKVIHETVGQYIGIKDKNGKKIFEGDIVWGDTIEGDWHKGVVEYNEDMGQYFVNAKSFMQYEKNSDSWSMLGCWTVEGNVFDNPELLNKIE
jgi:uncharacterized phage protein (TIGR01671 family)